MGEFENPTISYSHTLILSYSHTLDKYVTIGYTKKAYGVKGQVKVVVEDRFLEDFVKSDFVFMDLLGKPAPFFIETIEDMGDLLLKVEEIDTPQQANDIVAKNIYLREKDLSNPIVEEPESDLEFSDLVGFLLADVEQGDIGTIKEIQEFPQQEIAVVEFEGKEIFIPLHEKLFTSIDEEGKKITLQLPEGLFDL